MNFAIYCRKSKYTASGESIANQLEYCSKYIELTFGNSVDINICQYTDEGYSGKSLDRPAFKTMLDDCYARKIDYIVVYRLDRISRNVADFSKLYQELLDLNIGFISTYERYDTSTSGGRAMLYMSCVFAQLERETVSERVKDSMYSLAKTGRWLGGVAPTGYTSVPCYCNGKVKYKLSLNEDIHTIELIFKKFLESHSIATVEEYLYNANIKSVKGNYYSKSSIKTILDNPVYCQSDSVSYEYFNNKGCTMSCTPKDCNGCGYMVYGRTSTSGGRVQKRVSYSDWVVSIGEHRGVISGMEWVSVQSILHCNSYKSKSIHNVNSLLSGMVYCPVCNSKMISRTKKFGFVYACSNKLSHGTKACKSPNIDSSLDDILLNSLFNTPPSDSVIPKLQALKQHIARGGEGTINLNANANPKHILLEGFKAMPIKLQREYIGKLLSSVKLTM